MKLLGKLKILLVVVIIVWLLPQPDVKAHSFDLDTVSVLRPVNSFYTFSVGEASILDEYLSPIKYSGYNLRVGYERIQATKFNPERWCMQLSAGLSYANVDNYVKSRKMHSLLVDFSWGMMYRWKLGSKFRMMFGGNTSLDGGVIYNDNNSNNPVSAKIHWSINPTAMAVCNLKLGNLPITFGYQMTLPVIGLFFSPEYGESFYEIYVGNRSNLVHVGWWGNRFDITNYLFADLHLGNTVLRLGYRGTYEGTFVNEIYTNYSTNSFTIALGGDWISISPNTRMSDECRIISVVY